MIFVEIFVFIESEIYNFSFQYLIPYAVEYIEKFLSVCTVCVCIFDVDTRYMRLDVMNHLN